MITRTTLKALWFGGGGIIATWLAVSPGQPPQGAPSTTAETRTAAEREPDAPQLTARADELRERTAVALARPTRNPFRFSAPRREAPARAPGPGPMASPETVIAPQRPPLVLSGVAQNAGKRTAVISSRGEIYLVTEGDTFAGEFTVVKVDPEAVLVRDAQGAELRLTLR